MKHLATLLLLTALFMITHGAMKTVVALGVNPDVYFAAIDAVAVAGIGLAIVEMYRK